MGLLKWIKKPAAFHTHHCSKVPMGSSQPLNRKFRIRTFNHSVTKYFLSELSNNNAWRNLPGFLNHFSHTIGESFESERIQNFRPYCDYFLSELSNSGTCDNPPGFLYHFSRTIVISVKLELLIIVQLFPIMPAIHCV